MSETSAIVGIFGAVDEVVQGDRQARERVAELLPEYRDPELHWYRDFKQWVADQARIEVPELTLPGAEAAFAELAETDPATRRDHARRLFAVEVASRALPELRAGPESQMLLNAQSALRAIGEAGPEGAAPGSRLYNLLAADSPVEPMEAGQHPGAAPWKAKIQKAQDEGILPPEEGFLPRPCLYRYDVAQGPTGPPAPVLITDFRTDEIGYDDLAFDDAIKFIEPLNWAKCMPNFWCDVRMTTRVGPNRRHYRERVSLDCAGTGAFGPFGVTVETDLLFDFVWVPEGQEADRAHARAALCNYQLLVSGPSPIFRILEVDEGTLLVAKAEPPAQTPLRIVTTKRLQFARPLLAKQIAIMASIFGYTEVSATLLYCAATKGQAVLGGPFPEFDGMSPAALARNPARPGPAGRAHERRSRRQARTRGPLQEAADIWARALREGAAAIERNAPP